MKIRRRRLLLIAGVERPRTDVEEKAETMARRVSWVRAADVTSTPTTLDNAAVNASLFSVSRVMQRVRAAEPNERQIRW